MTITKRSRWWMNGWTLEPLCLILQKAAENDSKHWLARRVWNGDGSWTTKPNNLESFCEIFKPVQALMQKILRLAQYCSHICKATTSRQLAYLSTKTVNRRKQLKVADWTLFLLGLFLGLREAAVSIGSPSIPVVVPTLEEFIAPGRTPHIDFTLHLNRLK